MLTIQILQHVHFEGPANIAKWIENNNHTIQFTRMYKGDILPDSSTYDILIVMGGPMGLTSTAEYPWVDDELRYIKSVIEANKPVLGVCLGAQFIAKALGSSVYQAPEKEIGWFPLTFENQLPTALKNMPPENLTTFHWHGDTFDIPKDAIRLAHTKGVSNQGFIYRDKVMALQFHLEMNTTSIENMLQHCSYDITQGTYIQSVDDIHHGLEHESDNYKVLETIMNYLASTVSKR